MRGFATLLLVPALVLSASPRRGGPLNSAKEAKRIADEIERHEFAVMREMQDAGILTDAGGKKLASWKQNKDSERVDWQAIAAAMNPPQELIAANTTTKPGARVFRVL